MFNNFIHFACWTYTDLWLNTRLFNNRLFYLIWSTWLNFCCNTLICHVCVCFFSGWLYAAWEETAGCLWLWQCLPTYPQSLKPWAACSLRLVLWPSLGGPSTALCFSVPLYRYRKNTPSSGHVHLGAKTAFPHFSSHLCVLCCWQSWQANSKALSPTKLI